MRALTLLLSFAALGCGDDAPTPVRAAKPEIALVEAPAPALRGSLLRVTGAALDLVGRAAELELFDGTTTASLSLAPGYSRGELFFVLDGGAVSALGLGPHALEATLRGNGLASDPYPFDLEIADELAVTLEAMLVGERHYNDVEIIRGAGYLAEEEGTLEAHFTGTFTRAAGGADVPIDVAIPVIQAERYSRDRGVVMLRTALGTAEPGSFTGEMVLESTLTGGATSTSAPTSVDLTFREPIVFGFMPPRASLGEYVILTGAGFLGAPPLPGEPTESTEVVLDGMFRPFEGGVGTPIAGGIVPLWVSGSEVRIEISTREQDGELVAGLFGARRGTFEGTARIRVGKGTVSYEGPDVPVSFELAPVRQVVHLSFLPGFYDALALFGLASSAGEIEARIEARIENIYRDYNVDVRLDPPDDFSRNGYAIVEIGGTDPNGVGLFGYDNTPGKDVNNLRLFDQIGGANAETQADGSPGYGGVFVESLLFFSDHPDLPGGRPPSSPPPDPLFDEIFDPVRDNPATLDEVRASPTDERTARVQRAIDALAHIIGETTSHELGHSLGLAQPYGSREAYHSAIPGDGCLMDSGSDRPLGERIGEPGFAETHFCADEDTYLFEILGG